MAAERKRVGAFGRGTLPRHRETPPRLFSAGRDEFRHSRRHRRHVVILRSERPPALQEALGRLLNSQPDIDAIAIVGAFLGPNQVWTFDTGTRIEHNATGLLVSDSPDQFQRNLNLPGSGLCGGDESSASDRLSVFIEDLQVVGWRGKV